MSDEASKDQNEDKEAKPAFDVPPSPIGDEQVSKKKKKKKRQKKRRGKAAKQKQEGRQRPKGAKKKHKSDAKENDPESSDSEVWINTEETESESSTPEALQVINDESETKDSDNDIPEELETNQAKSDAEDTEDTSDSVTTWVDSDESETSESDETEPSDDANEPEDVEEATTDSEEDTATDTNDEQDEAGEDTSEDEELDDEGQSSSTENEVLAEGQETQSDEVEDEIEADENEDTETGNDQDVESDDEEDPVDSESNKQDDETDKKDSDEDSDENEQDSVADANDEINDDEESGDEDEEDSEKESDDEEEDDLPPTDEQPIPLGQESETGFLSKLPIAIRSHLTNAINDKELRTYVGGAEFTSSPRKKFFAVVAGIAALYGTAAGAYNLDQSLAGSGAPRGSHLAGYEIEHLSSGQVGEAAQEIALDINSSVVEVNADSTTTEILVSDLGLTLQTDEVTRQAMESRDSQFFALRPISWITNVFGAKTNTPLLFDSDPEMVAEVTHNRVTEKLLAVSEPSFEFSNGSFTATEGSAGVGLFDSDFEALYTEAINDGPPYQVSLKTKITTPKVTLEEAQALASEVEPLIEDPLLVNILDQTVLLEGSEMKDWFGVALDEDDVPVWVVNSAAANETISGKVDNLGLPDVDGQSPAPTFTVIDNQPILLPPAADIECCSTESGVDLKIALLSNATTAEPEPSPEFDTMQAQCKRDGRVLITSENSDLEVRRARIEPRFLTPNREYSELAELGIVEEVSSCTTSHAAGQGRVVNIQTFADIMRGTVIQPGETLSLNEHVGRRTTDKGFVPAGAIVDGVIRNDNVGGGISQFITTFFNASFFSGVELVEYQSHSLYISRYPKGLEATISWGGPEQIIKNDTEHGILVWTEHTPTSITVTFYSTKHRDVEAMAPVQYRSGAGCYTVQVGRKIDGTEDVDAVEALYRDREGYNCNGNPTRAQQEIDAANNPAAPEITVPPTVPGAPVVPPTVAITPPAPVVPPTTGPGAPIIEIPVG